MGDVRLRELERRWRESGADEDEAAWLVARVRSGDLELARLECAALCGHPGAALAWSRSDERPLIPRAEFATHVGVGLTTLTRWRREQGLPFLKQGRRVVYDVPPVLDWLWKREAGWGAASPFHLLGNSMERTVHEASLRALRVGFRMLAGELDVPPRMAAALALADAQLGLAPEARDQAALTRAWQGNPWEAESEATVRLAFAIYIVLDGLREGTKRRLAVGPALEGLHGALAILAGYGLRPSQERLLAAVRDEVVPWVLR